MSKTNAARILDGLGIAYEIRTYEVDPDDLAHVGGIVGEDEAGGKRSGAFRFSGSEAPTLRSARSRDARLHRTPRRSESLSK